MYSEMAIAELELIFFIYKSLGLSPKFFLSMENFQSPTGKDLKITDPAGMCSSQGTIPGKKCPLPLGHQLIGAHIEYLNFLYVGYALKIKGGVCSVITLMTGCFDRHHDVTLLSALINGSTCWKCQIHISFW